jgi:hypothetical protein
MQRNVSSIDRDKLSAEVAQLEVLMPLRMGRPPVFTKPLLQADRAGT